MVDLNFAMLRECAVSSTDPKAPIGILNQKCEQLAEKIREWARAECQAIISELEPAADWAALPQEKRMALFARRVQGFPPARRPLLFSAVRGELDHETIFRITKTPRGLMTLALNLGCTTDLPQVGPEAKATSTWLSLPENRR